MLCADFGGRTCLVFSREKGRVVFSPLDLAGLRIRVESGSSFDQSFKPVEHYTVERAAKQYLKFAESYGATKTVLEHLSKLIKIPKALMIQAQEKVEARSSSKGPSAAEMFRELIIEGKLSDDDIFKKVQEEFKLPDNRRAYVNWYRKDLIKKGKLLENANGK